MKKIGAQFQANDGSLFNTETECERYENSKQYVNKRSIEKYEMFVSTQTTTADGYNFEFGEYYVIDDSFWWNPLLLELDETVLDLEYSSGKLYVLYYDYDKGKSIPYPLSKLYATKEHALKKLIELRNESSKKFDDETKSLMLELEKCIH